MKNSMWEGDGIFHRVYSLPYGSTTQFQLFDAAKNSRKFIQKLRLQVKLPVHNGCVNSICWNDTGEYLLSGSDDQHLCITHGYKHTVLANIQTGHRANIFSAKFLPSTGDTQVISCSGDGIVIYSNLEHSESSLHNLFSCHFGTAYEIMTVPNDPHTFLSCGEDGTVRWFDLRAKTRCVVEECKEDILINCRCAVTSLAVNPLIPCQLAVGCADASVRIFDRRMLGTRATGNYMGSGIQAMMAHFTVPEFSGQSRRITSLSYSPDGREMLVSYSSDYIYLFDVKDNFEKEAKILRSESPAKDSDKSGDDKSSGGRPLMKRLRVRGDWSDTGPNARPESESRVEQQPRSLHASLMQRMSDVLTRMFNTTSRLRRHAAASHVSSTSAQISSHSGSEVEASDEERDGPESSQDANSNQFQGVGLDLSKENECKRETENVENQSTVNESHPHCSSNMCHDISSTALGIPSCSKDQAESKVETAMEVDSENEDNSVSDVVDFGLEYIEQKLSLRRDDLIARHQMEPRVRLHFTGEGVTSGSISMNVADSGDNLVGSVNPDETSFQCTQQSQNDDVCMPSQLKQEILEKQEKIDSMCGTETVANYPANNGTVIECSSSVSENSQNNLTAAVSITTNDSKCSSDCQPRDSGIITDSNINEVVVAEMDSSHENNYISENENASHASQSNDELETVVSNLVPDEEEPELLMEMDAWYVDSSSDEEPARERTEEQSSPQSFVSNRSETGNVPENILRSIDEELKCCREELRKEKVQMMNIPCPRVKRKFTGHRNARTMIKEATFWGNNFIMSGSDCGHIFVWDRYTSELVMLMEADHHVVNCLQPHPFDPVLASSGIDYDIKLWAPLKDEPFFDMEKASEIVKRNEVMLEETKDTITVPASFMIRMLASLNHLTSSGSNSWRRAARASRNDPDSNN